MCDPKRTYIGVSRKNRGPKENRNIWILPAKGFWNAAPCFGTSSQDTSLEVIPEYMLRVQSRQVYTQYRTSKSVKGLYVCNVWARVSVELVATTGVLTYRGDTELLFCQVDAQAL